jgi:hypothetical protein
MFTFIVGWYWRDELVKKRKRFYIKQSIVYVNVFLIPPAIIKTLMLVLKQYLFNVPVLYTCENLMFFLTLFHKY